MQRCYCAEACYQEEFGHEKNWKIIQAERTTGAKALNISKPVEVRNAKMTRYGWSRWPREEVVISRDWTGELQLPCRDLHLSISTLHLILNVTAQGACPQKTKNRDTIRSRSSTLGDIPRQNIIQTDTCSPMCSPVCNRQDMEAT